MIGVLKYWKLIVGGIGILALIIFFFWINGVVSDRDHFKDQLGLANTRIEDLAEINRQNKIELEKYKSAVKLADSAAIKSKKTEIALFKKGEKQKRKIRRIVRENNQVECPVAPSVLAALNGLRSRGGDKNNHED